MKQFILRIVKAYVFVTVVAVLNIALCVGAFWLYQRIDPMVGQPMTSWEDVPGLEQANGDSAIVQRNLSRMNDLHLKGIHADLRTILKYCGTPDGNVGDLHSDLHLLYHWNRFADNDWTAQVSLSEGFLVGIGYYESTIDDHPDYKPWDIPQSTIPQYK